MGKPKSLRMRELVVGDQVMVSWTGSGHPVHVRVTFVSKRWTLGQNNAGQKMHLKSTMKLHYAHTCGKPDGTGAFDPKCKACVAHHDPSKCPASCCSTKKTDKPTDQPVVGAPNNPPLVAPDGSKSVGVQCCDRSFATAAEADAHEKEHQKRQRDKVHLKFRSGEFVGPWSVGQKTVRVLLEDLRPGAFLLAEARKAVQVYRDGVASMVAEMQEKLPTYEDLPFWKRALQFWTEVLAATEEVR